MQTLFIRAVNAEFQSRDKGDTYDRPEDALILGIQGAVGLVTDEIHRGQRSAAVEISIERGDGTTVLRSVIALSVSPLMTAVVSGQPAND